MFLSRKSWRWCCPCPCPCRAPAEDALTFINLEDCADFFEDLSDAFPSLQPVVTSAGNRHGPDAMYAHYGITVHDWSQISSYWVGQVTTDPQLGAKLSNLMVPLQQQLDAGAPPPPVHQGDAPAVSKDEVVGAAQKFSTDLQNKMQGASGGAPPPPSPPAPSAALTMGSGCMVQWSDGNQYPGTVKQLSGAHALVAFPNGREEWIEQKLVSPA